MSGPTGVQVRTALTELAIIENTDSAFEVEFYVPPDLPFFKDHFPDRPVVPGVVQIQWAFELAGSLVPEHTHYTIKKLKFDRPMLPAHRYKVALELVDGNTLSFQFLGLSTERARYSAGNITFHS